MQDGQEHKRNLTKAIANYKSQRRNVIKRLRKTESLLLRSVKGIAKPDRVYLVGLAYTSGKADYFLTGGGWMKYTVGDGKDVYGRWDMDSEPLARLELVEEHCGAALSSIAETLSLF
jgi:hypothetical protein